MHKSARKKYIEKSRRQRRSHFVSKRWEIACDRNGLGFFITHHMMNGGVYNGSIYTGSPDSQWNDFQFISQVHAKEGIVYSATVQTVQMALMGAAERYAWDSEESILTPEEYALAHPKPEFEPLGKGMFALKDQETALFDRLGGISAWGVRANALRESVLFLDPISPSCKLDYSYSSGVGIVFIVDKPNLTRENIVELIQDFYTRGEVAYTDPPVPLDRPDVSEWLMKAVDYTAKSWERMDASARAKK